MIVTVRGVLEARYSDAVVVGVGGISLRLPVPASTLARLGPVGERVTLHTHLYVREDNLTLYGFATQEELELFELLLTVSGVGPRVALALLSGASVESLRLAIGSGNAELLTTIPGVGRKLAGRLVLDLKGKIQSRGLPGVVAAAAAADVEVLAALTNLGYSVADAQRAIQSLPPDASLSTEEKIVLALRHFSQ